MGSSALRKEVVSVGKHSLVYVIGQAISRAVGFLMIPLYTSYIAPSHYGAMELIEIVTAACLMLDRKSTRLNSSHVERSYAVFCLKKKIGPEPARRLRHRGLP